MAKEHVQRMNTLELRALASSIFDSIGLQLASRGNAAAESRLHMDRSG
jgi:hypothetical protein